MALYLKLFTAQKETLGILEVLNDGTGDEKIGNYEWKLMTADPAGGLPIIAASGRLEGYDRSDGAWTLSLRALADAMDALGERPPQSGS
jgi:hypothetical protein